VHPAAQADGFVARFIRTLKGTRSGWVRFDTREELREASQEFRPLYNRHWLIERHG
jgi:hypothetical protein